MNFKENRTIFLKENVVFILKDNILYKIENGIEYEISNNCKKVNIKENIIIYNGKELKFLDENKKEILILENKNIIDFEEFKNYIIILLKNEIYFYFKDSKIIKEYKIEYYKNYKINEDNIYYENGKELKVKYFNLEENKTEEKNIISKRNIKVFDIYKNKLAYTDNSNKIKLITFNDNKELDESSVHINDSSILKICLNEFLLVVDKSKMIKYEYITGKKKYINYNGNFRDIKLYKSNIILLTSVEYIIFNRKSENFERKFIPCKFQIYNFVEKFKNNIDLNLFRRQKSEVCDDNEIILSSEIAIKDMIGGYLRDNTLIYTKDRVLFFYSIKDKIIYKAFKFDFFIEDIKIDEEFLYLKRKKVYLKYRMKEELVYVERVGDIRQRNKIDIKTIMKYIIE